MTGIIIVIIIYLIVFKSPLLDIWMNAYRVEPEIRKADVIIVLSGGAFANGVLMYWSIIRLIQGVSLFQQGFAPRMIVSGGPNYGPTKMPLSVIGTVKGKKHKPLSDAELMKRMAVSLGMPESSILIEGNSFNTYENVQNCLAIMKEEDFKDALIVTNKSHLFRTMRICKKTGSCFYPVPPREAGSSPKILPLRMIMLWELTWELAGLLVFKLKGWI